MLIAQISDLHIRGDGTLLQGRIDTEAALAACVAHLNRLDPRPDVVLATGDLVDLGRPFDYRSLRDLLDRIEIPVYIIPGNHDDRDNLRSTFADRGYLPANGDFLHYTVERFPLRLIGLDTVIPGEVSGGVCAERLSWLGARLAEQPDRETVLFMHHPPFATGIRLLDAPPFEGASLFEALIARHRQVRQIVCGHVHRAIHTRWAGTSAAIAPSTVYQMNLGWTPGARYQPTTDPAALSLYLWLEGSGLVGYTSLIEGCPPQLSAAAGP
jgi:3',5'-cyclic AMP phosphodiesterase CpdA